MYVYWKIVFKSEIIQTWNTGLLCKENYKLFILKMFVTQGRKRSLYVKYSKHNHQTFVVLQKIFHTWHLTFLWTRGWRCLNLFILCPLLSRAFEQADCSNCYMSTKFPFMSPWPRLPSKHESKWHNLQLIGNSCCVIFQFWLLSQVCTGSQRLLK